MKTKRDVVRLSLRGVVSFTVAFFGELSFFKLLNFRMFDKTIDSAGKRNFHPVVDGNRALINELSLSGRG